MNKAMRARMKEIMLGNPFLLPKEIYDQMRLESIDDKKYNHAVWMPDGSLQRRAK